MPVCRSCRALLRCNVPEKSLRKRYCGTVMALPLTRRKRRYWVPILVLAFVTLRAIFNLCHQPGPSDFVDKSLREVLKGRRDCQPRHRVMYLKTHKCASSTLQNILLRYAITHRKSGRRRKAQWDAENGGNIHSRGDTERGRSESDRSRSENGRGRSENELSTDISELRRKENGQDTPRREENGEPIPRPDENGLDEEGKIIVSSNKIAEQVPSPHETNQSIPKYKNKGELNVISKREGRKGGENMSDAVERDQEEDPIFVAVPARGTYLGNPQKFSAAMLKHQAWLLPPSGRVDMFAVHARLAVSEMRQVVGQGALWVTAVRHPVSLYTSLFHYFKAWGEGKGLRSFLIRPLSQLRRSGRLNGRIGINQMTFDLGYDPDTFYDDEKIDLMIQEVETNFDLVLVTERMDESLILLGRALCWQTEDLLALKKNVMMAGSVGKGGGRGTEQELTEEEREKLEQLNYSDLRLYNHFAAKFDQLVERYGRERLAGEVEELRRERKKLVEFCVEEFVPGHDPRASVREYSEGVIGFRLARPDHPTCRTLVWNARHFADYFRNRQRAMFERREGGG